MLNNLRSFFVLIRWFHGLLALFPFVTLYLIIVLSEKRYDVPVSGLDFALICICVQLLMAIGFIWNDWRDLGIDRINKPHSHIVGRKLSLNTVQWLFALITVSVIALSTYISVRIFPEWAWISASVYVLSIAYSWFLKRSPLFGNVTIAILGAFVPLVLLFFARDAVAALTNERVEVLIYIYALLLFAIIVPRELSLDISDIQGDQADGCYTLPIVIGVKKARKVVVLMILALIAVSVPVMQRYDYLTYTFVVVDVLLLFYLFIFRRSHSRLELIRAGRFLWFVLIVGIIGSTIASLI